MTQLFTTQDVQPEEAADYWHETLRNVYVQLDCTPAEPSRHGLFSGEIRQDQFSVLGVSVVTASPQSVVRSPKLIRQSTEDVFIVSIQTQGRSQILQDGRSAELSTGDFAFYDSTRPYDLLYPDGIQQVVLKLPRKMLLSRLPGAESLTARRVSGRKGAGRLMINMIETLLSDVGDLDPNSFDAIANGVVDILTAGLKTLTSDRLPQLSSMTAYHMQQIQSYVTDHLHDPKLSVQGMAGELQLSVSSLYRIFESQPQTLSDFIWTQRLDRCKRDLADPELRNLSVTQIAYRWGFSDSAHLSRTFKRTYGQSPRDFRKMCGQSVIHFQRY